MGSNRTTVLGGIWGKNAADAPTTPVAGTAYGYAGMTQAEIEAGWLFDTVVSSPKLNEVMRRLTGLMYQLERTGILPWCGSIPYLKGAYALGSDDLVYKAESANTNNDPVTSPTYWTVINQVHGKQTFMYTGGNQTFTVPAGVKRIYITACGGGGAGANDTGNATAPSGETTQIMSGTSNHVYYATGGGGGKDGNAGGTGGNGGYSVPAFGSGQSGNYGGGYNDGSGGGNPFGQGGKPANGLHGSGFGGGGSGLGYGSADNNGGGGGGAGFFINYPMDVVPLETITVYVGNKGTATAGAGNGTPGIAFIEW